jgi:hypothetical protein
MVSGEFGSPTRQREAGDMPLLAPLPFSRVLLRLLRRALESIVNQRLFFSGPITVFAVLSAC